MYATVFFWMSLRNHAQYQLYKLYRFTKQFSLVTVKLAFHDADTNTDILADIFARIVARMSACRSACHKNDFNRTCRTCRRGSSWGSRCRCRGMQHRHRHRHQLPREDPRGDVGEEIRPHFTTLNKSSPTTLRGCSRGCRRVSRVREDPRE